MHAAPKVTAEQIEAAIKQSGEQDWYHRFEIIKGSGAYTPGHFEPNIEKMLERIEVDKGIFKGKRVLDIGAYTGAFSYFYEDCGADVVALDVYDPDKNGFNVVHSIRNSKVEHRLNTVYELNPDEFGYFDIISFFGVFYHLRYPILAFERINSVSRKGTLLIGGGTTCDGYFGEKHVNDGLLRHHRGSTTKAQDEYSEGGRASEVSAVRLDNTSDFPICFYQPRKLGTAGQSFFIPNRRCLIGWIESTGFEVELSYVWAGRFRQTQTGTNGSQITEKINRLAQRYLGDTDARRSTASFKAHYAGEPQTETDDMENMAVYSIPTNYELSQIKEQNKASEKALYENQ